MIFTNPAKEKLRAGEPVVGFNVFECLRPSVARIVAQNRVRLRARRDRAHPARPERS